MKALYESVVCHFQGQIVYSLSGVYPAQQFFRINETSGAIYLKRSLKEDNLRLFKYTVCMTALGLSSGMIIFPNKKVSLICHWCTLHATTKHPSYTLNAPRMHHPCTTHPPPIHHLCTTSAPQMHHSCTTRALPVHHPCKTLALPSHYTCTACTIYAPPLATCAPPLAI